MAVGDFVIPEALARVDHPVVVVWNGFKWNQSRVGVIPGIVKNLRYRFNDVVCRSGRGCIIAGGDESGQFSLQLRWHDSRWSRQAMDVFDLYQNTPYHVHF